MPTPPRPTTTTSSPGRTAPAFTTAPPPVSTAHPSTAATSGGTSAPTTTAERRSTTACVANPETPRWWCTGPSVAVQADAAVEERARGVRRGARRAGHDAAGAASVALAAPRQERRDDPVADGEARSGCRDADRLDDARGLVAEQHRHGPRAVAVDHGQVGVAHARRLDAHEQLVGAGRIELELADGDRARRRERTLASELLEHGAGDGAGGRRWRSWRSWSSCGFLPVSSSSGWRCGCRGTTGSEEPAARGIRSGPRPSPPRRASRGPRRRSSGARCPPSRAGR